MYIWKNIKHKFIQKILYIVLNNCETFSIGLDKYMYVEKLYQHNIDDEEYMQGLIDEGYTIVFDVDGIMYTLYNFDVETKKIIVYSTAEEAYTALKGQITEGEGSL